jgi:hypothetical protein
MANKSFMKAAAFLLFSMGLVAGAFAQVTISGGFALSSVSATDGSYTIKGTVGAGANVYLDYMLPVGVPLSLGAEIGIDNAALKEGDYSINITAIPILIRAAYHFDLMQKLDLYLVGKLGLAFGSSEDITEDISGFAFGIDVGAAYYFSSTIGVFGEVGFDDYMLQAKATGYTIDVPFNRFFTAGISAKF